MLAERARAAKQPLQRLALRSGHRRRGQPRIAGGDALDVLLQRIDAFDLEADVIHVRKSFDLENIDLDDLIATVMTDKQAVAGEIAAFRGIKFTDLHTAYKQICKHEKVANSVVDVDQLIEFYNRAVADLPDHSRLKDLHLPGMTTVLDGKGAKFAELFEPDNRRHWVPLADIPEFVQKAFVAAEDKRFFEHNGVDERSVIRAFINMTSVRV